MNNMELLKEFGKVTGDKDSLKFVSCLTELDFNKEFEIVKVEKPFTLNSLSKEFDKHYDNIYCFIQDKRYSSNENEFRYVKIHGFTQFDVHLKYNSSRMRCYSRNLSNYYRKSDFNDARKQNKLAYIIAFNNESKKEVKKEFNLMNCYSDADILLDRFRKEEDRWNSAYYKVIGQMSNSYTKQYENIEGNKNLEVDKSGYIVSSKHAHLQDQLRQLKANRDKLALTKWVKEGNFEKLKRELEEVQEQVRRYLLVRLSTFEFNTGNDGELHTIEHLVYSLSFNQLNKNFNPLSFYSIQDVIDRVESLKRNTLDKYTTYTKNQSPLTSFQVKYTRAEVIEV